MTFQDWYVDNIDELVYHVLEGNLGSMEDILRNCWYEAQYESYELMKEKERKWTE